MSFYENPEKAEEAGEAEEAEKPGSFTLNDPDDMPVVYANLCGVASSPEEIILTFAQRDIEDPTQGRGVVRVYTNPAHAQRLAEVLTRVLRQRAVELAAALPDDIRKYVVGAEEQEDSNENDAKTK